MSIFKSLFERKGGTCCNVKIEEVKEDESENTPTCCTHEPKAKDESSNTTSCCS